MTPPDPTSFRNLHDWARSLFRYMTRPPSGQPTDPQPILLAHKVGDERAPIDGLLMYDPVAGKPVVSIGGVWRTFTLDP